MATTMTVPKGEEMTALEWYEREEARILGRLKGGSRKEARPTRTLWERLRGAPTTPAAAEAAAEDSGLKGRPGGSPKRFDLDLLDHGLEEVERALHRGTRSLRKAARRLHKATRRAADRVFSARSTPPKAECLAQKAARSSIPVEVQAERVVSVLAVRVEAEKAEMALSARVVATRVIMVDEDEADSGAEAVDE